MLRLQVTQKNVNFKNSHVMKMKTKIIYIGLIFIIISVTSVTIEVSNMKIKYLQGYRFL